MLTRPERGIYGLSTVVLNAMRGSLSTRREPGRLGRLHGHEDARARSTFPLQILVLP